MVGTTVSHYRIVEKLGEGGMGVVYKAEDEKLQRTVALKFLPLGQEVGDTDKQRFLIEARAAAALDHPNVCTVYEIDQVGDRMFIAMAYLEGEDLSRKLSSGPLKAEAAVDIALQVADGLSGARSRGMIHRDIKPANIRLTTGGRAVIMDFGVARLPGSTVLTDFGTSVGTPAYMAPEQLTGDEVDQRSDIWSLGAVLYEMLAGTPPFEGGYVAAILYSVLNQEPEPLSLNSPHAKPLNKIVLKAMAKDRSDRYLSVEEFMVALRNLSESSAAKTQQAGHFDPRGATIALTTTVVPVGPSLAVIPFENRSPDPENEYFSDGITEDIIGALTKIDGLRVASRNSAFQFKGQSADLALVGQKLRVGAVLTGSARFSGKRLRINASLSNVEDGFEIWSERYDRVIEDVFDVQDEISQAIAQAMQVELGVGSDTPNDRAAPGNLEAYNLYLKARYYAAKLTLDGLQEAIGHYSSAIVLDPGYALPRAGTAVCYAYLALHGWAPPREMMPRSMKHASEALELDPALGQAHMALGMVKHWYDWDLDGAESDYQKAIEINPNDVDSMSMYATLLAVQGRADEANQQVDQALALDPVSLDARRLKGYVLYLTRNFPKAVARAERTLAMDPTYFPANWTVGMAAVASGDNQKGLKAWRRSIELSPNDPISQAGNGWIAGLMNDKETAKRVADSFEKERRESYFSAYFLAWVWLGIGDQDRVMEYLEQAYEDREGLLVQIQAEALWDPMRDDPRFMALLARIDPAGMLARHADF